MIYTAIDSWSPYISHHGVKGMKWGVRKARETAGRVRAIEAKAKQKRYAKSDYARAKNMSNAELQTAINRINLEQSYISAMQRDRTAYKDATDNILMKTGRRTVTSLYNKFINSGSSAIDIMGGLTRNAIVNSANKVAPITKKPKK